MSSLVFWALGAILLALIGTSQQMTPRSTNTQRPTTAYHTTHAHHEALSVNHPTHVEFNELKQIVNELKQKLTQSQDNFEGLSRQLMLQQLFVEEKIRSDGSSGLKQIRHHIDGTRAYFGESHSGKSVAAIHDHSNNDRTVGMGEIVAVLNGVEFRTRHNDYRLRMASKTSGNYNSMEDVPFPDVPPAVLAKSTPHEQIAEMREWFKAWRDQDHSVRDYRPYFRPVLCYLEGAWTTDTKHLNEPFFSDRHQIDASSWFDLQEKVRFTSYSGGKSYSENYAYLPTTIINVQNGTPEYAQWNYRIACHPIKGDIPTKAFHLVDDLKVRMSKKWNMTQYAQSRAARFTLVDKMPKGNTYQFRDRTMKWGLLDDIMLEVPGKNNYIGQLNDDSLGLPVSYIRYKADDTALNTAFYHRLYKLEQKDDMGRKHIHRGFSDEHLFVSQTTQPKIAPMRVTDCKKMQAPDHEPTNNCTTYTQRFTYAIPLEIIYLTPLYQWNPYDIEQKGSQNSNTGRTVTLGGRNGKFTPIKAYNGTNSKVHYLTPSEFFQKEEVQRDKIDTSKGTVGVLDRIGIVRTVVASGTRIFLPNIPNVGELRTRYPIMPVHGEGTQAWRELDAMKAMVMNIPLYANLFETPPNLQSDKPIEPEFEIEFETDLATRDPPGAHTHYISISNIQLKELKASQHITVFTTTSNGHEHAIEMAYNGTSDSYYMKSCDWQPECWDHHGRNLHVLHVH